MRSGPMRYPVDRYLDKSNKKFELVNIIDDDIWNPEPALRPEDEIILRKLHEMLQTTTDDLKQLSGEIAKFHEPGVVYKTAPTPFDEEFNEKVHIEEIVNAKFHGHKMINRPLNIPKNNQTHEAELNSQNLSKPQPKKCVENTSRVVHKRPNLGVSRVRIMQINGKNEDSLKPEKLNNGKVLNNVPVVGYNEFNFTYDETKRKESPRIVLQVQNMPSINIRNALKRQNVLQLEILPENKNKVDLDTANSNVSVITLRHETGIKLLPDQNVRIQTSIPPHVTSSNNAVRKVSKMSPCESSASTNNVSSDSKAKLIMQKRLLTSIRNSPKSSARNRSKKPIPVKKETEKQHRTNLEEWKRKLHAVYGTSKSKNSVKQTKSKSSPKTTQALNKTQYIPYSKLTVGGVRVSDIEKEIADLPNKNEVPLSPILDIILNSRENSCRVSPRKLKDTPRILTTSDENLLQEVIDIEKRVTDTLTRNTKRMSIELEIDKKIYCSDDSERNESYDDDFEDEKSEHSHKESNKAKSDDNLSENRNQSEADDTESDLPVEKDIQHINKNATYTKSINLSIKDSVDIFEFIHLVDTQDTATQSNVSDKISPKQTQTSPLNEKLSSSIHNDLWPSIDPRREVEKMFEIEKEFIKKLILEEYGDILEKNINKPSTSKERTHEGMWNNVTALQKTTQTSPAHMKSVMTSPKRTKTRTTSPFNLTVPADKTTSPMVFVTNEGNNTVDVKTDSDDISVNLSSPRFSLRLPQTSREVLSNITVKSRSSATPPKISSKTNKINNKTYRKTSISSSSSIDGDNSSSDLSSLGEVKIRNRLKKRMPSLSECSSTSTLSKCSVDLSSLGLLPLKSEGEVSVSLTRRQRNSRRSEGETSFGPK